MTELVSVGGICFVAVPPENANQSDKSDIAESQVTVLPSVTAKRKYRPRGERTRKEQQREASRRYYWSHRSEKLARGRAWRLANLEKFRARQRKYRILHRDEINKKQHEYYQSHRMEISRKAHLAYLRRKERNETLSRLP